MFKIKNQKLTRDVILVASLLLISLIALFVSIKSRKPGAYARIEVDSQLITMLSLDTDTTYTLDCGNVLIVENGTVRMEKAPCPDKVCVNTGRISYIGQTIVCLPNRVTVTVVGEGDGVDFVS